MGGAERGKVTSSGSVLFFPLPLPPSLHFSSLFLPPSLPVCTLLSLLLHRSAYFSYQKDESLYDIGLYRFVFPAVELLNTSQDPGFYPNGPSGVLNLTSVFPENAPVFASKPHFLDAFAGYWANVSGMDPDRYLHDSHLDVEPITGEGGREGGGKERGREGGEEGRRGGGREGTDELTVLSLPCRCCAEGCQENTNELAYDKELTLHATGAFDARGIYRVGHPSLPPSLPPSFPPSLPPSIPLSLPFPPS